MSFYRGKAYGGGGGNSYARSCYGGELVTGIEVRTGKYVDALEKLHCKKADNLNANHVVRGFRAGGGGGHAHTLDCPKGTAAVGLAGRSGSYMDKIQLVCNDASGNKKSYTGAPGGGGGRAFEEVGRNNQTFITALYGRSGSYLDQIQPMYWDISSDSLAKNPGYQAECCFGRHPGSAFCTNNACDENNIKAFCESHKTDPKCKCIYPTDLPQKMIDLRLAPCYSGECVEFGHKLQWMKERAANCPGYVDCSQYLDAKAGGNIKANPYLSQRCGNIGTEEDPTKVPAAAIEESVFDNKVMWTIIVTTLVITVIILLAGLSFMVFL